MTIDPGDFASRSQRAAITAALTKLTSDSGRAGRLAARYRRWREVDAILNRTVDSLWRDLLTAENRDDIPLDGEQKVWLLVNAGLLRGFNLALITAWRTSGDTLMELESNYPGFGVLANHTHERMRVESIYLSTPPGEDHRASVQEVIRHARRILAETLELGYGAGFCVDEALSDFQRSLSRPASAPGRRQPGLLAAASNWAAHLDRTVRRERVAQVLADLGSRINSESIVADASLTRPLSVPERIVHYSEDYVCTMLAYLIRWWIGIGVGAAHQDPFGAVDASRGDDLNDELAGWLHDLAIVWAREETPAMVASAQSQPGLRWQLADLAQMCAILGADLRLALARPPYE